MKYVVIFLIVVLFCQLIIHWPIRQEEKGGVVIWRSSQEKMDFYRLLHKHGQHKQISVTFHDGSKAYSLN